MAKELDAFKSYVDNTCTQLNKENQTFENMKSSTGLNVVMEGFTDILKNGPLGIIKQSFGEDSALRTMGEDVLASTINDNARKLSQNIMGQLAPGLKTMADVRDQAINALVTVLTFKNDMVLYFAAVAAKECIKSLNDKDLLLQDIHEKVRRLHNALLALAGGGPFFNKYLENLRSALILVHKAEDEISLTRSAFFSTNIFPQSHFTDSKSYLTQAYDLIMPPVTGEDAKELKEGFLKGVLSGPDYKTQLSMLTVIPGLTLELLKSYDFYVLKVIKTNALLLGFQSIVQNLKEVSNSSFKELVISSLTTTQTDLHDLVGDMAQQLNGDETIIDSKDSRLVFDKNGNASLVSPAKNYKPNPTKTSGKTLKWAVRLKIAQANLELISAEGMGNLDDSNAALRAYNLALDKLSRLDTVRTSSAVVEFTNGIETPGAFEADMTLFAIQANHALIDTSLLEADTPAMKPKSVLSIGAKLTAELDIILERDSEIEEILVEFVSKTKNLLVGLNKMGDSMFKVLDKLGMDKASDALKNGALGDIFSMSGKTGSYIGAAVTGLTMVQAMAASTEQRECINNTINQLIVHETSLQLVAARTSQENFVAQQTKNKKRCEQLQAANKKVESCAVGINVSDLLSNPLPELSKVFGGLFGGPMFESLGTIPNPIKKVSSIAANSNAISAIKSAADKTKAAKGAMVDALNTAEGYKASAEESLSSLQAKVTSAAAQATGKVSEALNLAGTKADVAKFATTKAKDAVDYAKAATTDLSSSTQIESVKTSFKEASLMK